MFTEFPEPIVGQKNNRVIYCPNSEHNHSLPDELKPFELFLPAVGQAVSVFFFHPGLLLMRKSLLGVPAALNESNLEKCFYFQFAMAIKGVIRMDKLCTTYKYANEGREMKTTIETYVYNILYLRINARIRVHHRRSICAIGKKKQNERNKKKHTASINR